MNIFPSKLPLKVMGVATLALAMAAPSAHAVLVSPTYVPDGGEFDGWVDLKAGTLTLGDLTAGFGSNETGSGDAVLTRLSGFHYPAGSSLYSFSGHSVLEVADTTTYDVATARFSILTWPNPDYGDGSTPDGSINLAPTLDFNSLDQNLAPTSVTSAYFGPFTGGGFDVESYIYTYEWDLSGEAANITAYDVEWGQIVHTGVLALQLDSKPAVVPLPPAVWLFGSAMVGLVGISRRRRERGDA